MGISPLLLGPLQTAPVHGYLLSSLYKQYMLITDDLENVEKAEGNVKYKIIISSTIVPPPLRDLLLTFWYVLSALCFLIHIICDAFNSICWWHRGAAGCASQWTQVPFKKHRSRLSLTL